MGSAAIGRGAVRGCVLFGLVMWATTACGTQIPTAKGPAHIAEVDGNPVGCVFCVRKDDSVAQMRLLLVDPNARGLGIGSRLVTNVCGLPASSATKRSCSGPTTF